MLLILGDEGDLSGRIARVQVKDSAIALILDKRWSGFAGGKIDPEDAGPLSFTLSGDRHKRSAMIR